MQEIPCQENNVTRNILLLATMVASVQLAFPASAYTDKATGFALAPPKGFVASRSSHRAHDVAIVVNSLTKKPASANADGTLCKAAYKSAPQNSALTREQINTMVNGEQRVNLIKTYLTNIFDILQTRRFTHQGYRSFEFVTRPKFGPNHENVRSFLSIIETVKGRATITCVTTGSEIKAALPIFRAIRARMKVPR